MLTVGSSETLVHFFLATGHYTQDGSVFHSVNIELIRQLTDYRHSPTYAVVPSRKIQGTSELSIHMVNYECIRGLG